MADRQVLIEEHIVAGRRLGRHVNHDERSKAYRAPQAPTLVTTRHTHYGPVLDQDGVGACTGFTGADWLNTAPAHHPRTRLYGNADGFSIYSAATHIDPFPGAWDPPPPGTGEDTGSDGLSVCKVLKARGLIAGYDHAFGLQECLAALVLSPVMVGCNWHEGMDHPDPKTGLVSIGGDVRGGHEFELLAINVRDRLVTGLNHWTQGWGLRGCFRMRWDALGELLENEQGDVTVPRLA